MEDHQTRLNCPILTTHFAPQPVHRCVMPVPPGSLCFNDEAQRPGINGDKIDRINQITKIDEPEGETGIER